MKKTAIVLPVLILSIMKLFAQELYIPRNIQRAIDKGTRTRQGVPGLKYWQNFAHYDLKITFNPKNLLVSGTETITYENNSPDSLRRIVMRIYPNYYKKGVMRDRTIDVADESDGVIIDNLTVGGEVLDVSAQSSAVVTDQTIMVIRKPVGPKQKITLEVTWHYTLNKGSHNRMGQVEEGSYFLGFPFPRIAVYDDANSWDVSQYMGQDEPYFDFGNFTAEVTVPKNYVVWATGELQNADEVFLPAIAAKLKSALASGQVTEVISKAEADEKKVTAKNKWNTFKFKASYVPDFAFGTSDHYMWQATGLQVDAAGRRVLVNTAFNPNEKSFYEVLEFARKTIEVMSFDFPGVPYPYPHMTVFQGADQMEYPMMVNDNPIADRTESIALTDHEIMHTFFPFYMGTNQTRYAWMDEGWATIGEWYISQKIDTTIVDLYGVDATRHILGTEDDLPLIIPSNQMNEQTYFVNAYPKPGFILLYLKDMLGDSLFRKSVQAYMDTWNGKHPLPWDFFYSINRACNQNLDWFWKAWYYDYGSVDLTVTEVKKQATGYDIVITSTGNKPVPVYGEVFFDDGSTQHFHETAAIWAKGNRTFVLTVTGDKEINKVVIHHSYVPDVNEKDNSWKAGE